MKLKRFMFNLVVLLTANVGFIYFLKMLNYILSLFNKEIKSLFFCYPAEERFFRYFMYDFTYRYISKNKLFPLIGFHIQNGQIGINFGLPYDENFIRFGDRKKLKDILDKINHYKDIANVEHVNYTGLLPSIIKKEGWEMYTSSDNSTVSMVVYESLMKVISKEGFSNPNIILLGGAGYIGSAVEEILKEHNFNICILDSKIDKKIIPEEFKKSETILIDVSYNKVIQEYIDQLWDDLVILNEVYPEPKNPEIFPSKNIYHIQGINAKVMPSLPYGYKNALPCCAIVPSEKGIKASIVKIKCGQGKDNN